MEAERIKKDLRVVLSEELKELGLSLEKLSRLFRNLPADEQVKKEFSENALKHKSAWYACLVNTNIDVLLIPEYLESKLSRNILIKKETEQYLKSVDNFKLHTVYSESSVYECILYSEEAKAKSGFDLFSSQAPETASCPADLQKLFELWDTGYERYSAFEKFVFSTFDWHRHNRFSFSGQRQFVLRTNYSLWKLFGPVALKLNIENYLFEHWNTTEPDAKTAISGLLGFLNREVERITSEMKDVYRKQIAYAGLKGIQRAVSNHLFDSGFNTGLRHLSVQNSTEIISLIQKKGFIAYHDFSSPAEIDKYKPVLTELLNKGVLLAGREGDEVCIYFNTSLANRQNRLFAYQNTGAMKSDAGFDDFVSQTPSRPVIAIETAVAASEPAAVVPVMVKKKAFFG